MTLHADARQALDEVVQLGASLEQAWLLLAHWINTRTNGLADADRQACAFHRLGWSRRGSHGSRIPQACRASGRGWIARRAKGPGRIYNLDS
jgi:hypothetical protein